MADPMMQLDPAGKAPLLSYNVPEPTSYSGRNGIVLDFGRPAEELFLPAAFVRPNRTPTGGQLTEITAGQIVTALRSGDSKMFPNIQAPAATHAGLFATLGAVSDSAGALDTASTQVLARGLRDHVVAPNLDALVHPLALPLDVAAQDGGTGTQTRLPLAVQGSILSAAALATQGVRPHLTELDPVRIVEQFRLGNRLNVYRSLWGEYVHTFQPEPPPAARPQLILVETYRLSSFLGQYGAGRTLRTFSLLPGEKTTISVKTFRRSEVERKQSSSVLDSFTKESADDFETSLQHEQSDKQAHQESLEYHIEAEANVAWGWGSAKVSGGVKGGTAAQREEFAKNASGAVEKHASKASSKRDVQVNTSSEVREESGEETSIVRHLENVNVGRVLNFVFRQMNQEHITILHLVDVRVAFWNGYAESAEEVPLPKLDGLLEKYVVEQRRTEVRQTIVDQLSTIFDHTDTLVAPPFVEKRQVGQNDSYLRVRKSMVSTYTDTTGNKISVPGVILAVNKIVMRTEGVIVDALLGQGLALDPYAASLQASAVRQRELGNAVAQAQSDQQVLARQIVTDADERKAKVYERVFESSVALPGKISVSAADDGIIVSSAQHAPAAGTSDSNEQVGD
jgi:hypothetical protein